jgi:hypothetical protein
MKKKGDSTMMDHPHPMYQKFVTGLVGTVLRHNPHLLAVNHFLIVCQRSEQVDRRLPSVRLVYGAAKRMPLAVQADAKTQHEGDNAATINTEAV